ncbi:TetR family transcriptional regulator [Mycobacteroides abscessus subsp. abscessus]|nr:TetR family transcriptional regulator [Mycobacteroides abscessus subsp. abscessus]
MSVASAVEEIRPRYSTSLSSVGQALPAQSKSTEVIGQMKRRRLSPSDRRFELLEVGVALFDEMLYEEVRMGHVAVRAGVSRSLVYRYFPSKRHFHLAVLAMRATRDHDIADFLLGQVNVIVDRQIDYFVAHIAEAKVIHRRVRPDSPGLQPSSMYVRPPWCVDRTDRMDIDARASDPAALALRGWLAFVRVVCAEWAWTQDISRIELTELCMRTFVGVFQPK